LQGNVTELGRFLAEELSVSLASSDNGFEVVDRTNLKAIIKENKLSLTGLIDPATAQKIGKIAGTDALITGTLTPFGDSVRLAVKVLDTSTAKIITASTINIAKTKAIEDLLGSAIKTDPTPQSSPTPKNNQKTTLTNSQTESIQKEEANGITFEIKNCTISGTSLICNLIVTNTEDDKELVIPANALGSKVKVYDDQGNLYIASKCQIGNVGEYLMLVSGIPTKIKFIFNNVSKNINKISLLQIDGRTYAKSEGTQSFMIKFKNIALK
jgi:hypothetical protein